MKLSNTAAAICALSLAGCSAALVFADDMLGAEYLSTGKYKLAVEEYTKSIMARPDRAQSFVNRGAAYVNTGELDKALKDENHAIQLLTNKKDSSLLGCAYFNRSVIEDKRNHKVKALKDAEEALKLDHTNADAQKYVLEHRQLRKNGKIIQDRVPLE